MIELLAPYVWIGSVKGTGEAYDRNVAILREDTYQRLSVKRFKSTCFLLITADDETHVHCGPSGTAVTYRHAWQIREWLQQSFGIDPSSVPMETFSMENFK